jgi:hypothetical protein
MFETERYIQSVPGGKLNIMGGQSIGQSKQKFVLVYIYVSYSERYSSKIFDKEEILGTVSNTGIYCSREKCR